MYHGHGVGATREQICWDHLAWLQCVNRFDMQYYLFAERIMQKDMFTGADTHCEDSEVKKVMEQVLAMGSYGVIRNGDGYTLLHPDRTHPYQCQSSISTE